MREPWGALHCLPRPSLCRGIKLKKQSVAEDKARDNGGDSISNLRSRTREQAEQERKKYGPKKTSWTASELLATEFPEPKWLIKDLLPEGLAILYGRPKIGKSWLALQLAQAVGVGGVALNQIVEQRKVFYFALEDNPRRIKTRMNIQGWPTNAVVDFGFELPRLAAGGYERLNEVFAGGASLVIVDTLSRFLPAKAEQNSTGEMTNCLDPLQKLALAHNATLLFIDHERKNQAEDRIDGLLGGTGKSAVADTLWNLSRQRGQKHAVLLSTGRDIEEAELALEFVAEGCFWHSLGLASEVLTPGQEEITATIKKLQSLNALPTNQNISKELDKDKGYISRELAELVQKEQIIAGEKVGKQKPFYLRDK